MYGLHTALPGYTALLDQVEKQVRPGRCDHPPLAMTYLKQKWFGQHHFAWLSMNIWDFNSARSHLNSERFTMACITQNNNRNYHAHNIINANLTLIGPLKVEGKRECSVRHFEKYFNSCLQHQLLGMQARNDTQGQGQPRSHFLTRRGKFFFFLNESNNSLQLIENHQHRQSLYTTQGTDECLLPVQIDFKGSTVCTPP